MQHVSNTREDGRAGRRRSDVCRCGTSSCARCAALRRYSAEILLAPGDRIILDDDSVTNLEARAARLVPATLYSRMLRRTQPDQRRSAVGVQRSGGSRRLRMRTPRSGAAIAAAPLSPESSG